MTFSLQITLLALHCGGCISYAIADRHPDPEETWIGSKHADFKKSTLLVKYVTSLYWSTVTFNTTGFGDFSAKTFSEMVFIIVYLLFASGLSLYIGACIIELIVRNTIATMNFVSFFFYCLIYHLLVVSKSKIFQMLE